MLKFKKSLGQNFLNDNNILKKIVGLDTIKNSEVLEIGPGIGNLTVFIEKEKPKSMLLIEKDKRFYNELKEKFKSKKNYKILNQDILTFNLNNFEKKNVIVFGNLPYNISTQILANFIKIDSWPPFYKKMIFMFQKEVANRILAKTNTKNYGRISVLTNLKLDVLESFEISKNSFFPRPKVDSKLVVFAPKKNLKYKILNIKNLEKITNIFFSNRRKMINKPLSKLFDNHEKIAKFLDLNINKRPSELTCENYYKLTEVYENNLKY